MYPHKGVDHLLEIADPEKDRIVLIGHFDSADPYHKGLLERIQHDPWGVRLRWLAFCQTWNQPRFLLQRMQ